MTVNTIEENVLPAHEPYVFTALDRCERNLSEQAYHRVTKGKQELLFCNHHYVMHEEKLLLDGWKTESDIAALRGLGNALDINHVE